MINPNSYFVLHSSCIPVLGIKRSTICDLQRQIISFIPNDLFEILTAYKKKSFEEILDKFGESNRPVLEDYFNFLVNKELGFWASEIEVEYFDSINLTYESPYKITNAIIDVNQNSNHNFDLIFKSFEELGGLDVQIRAFCKLEYDILKEIVECSKGLRLNSIQIIAKFNDELTLKALNELLATNLKITLLVFHSAPEERYWSEEISPIILTKEKIDGKSHCGIISPDFFSVSLTFFSEAKSMNTCLNGKISIDENGYIRNCPSCKDSFGSYKDTDLQFVVSNTAFTNLWKIKKDDITICKSCEFRYICSDCRAYLVEPDNLYSKPLKCGYNPETTEWEDWSLNPLNLESKKFYNLI
ncbi:MAG: grasp-with-spasm system SPASM domain peptide maturase [Cytophagales bacterium]|nr:grasp-with-spasm system SPASM domain peptide maturase [Cytophagales bacterium]